MPAGIAGNDIAGLFAGCRFRQLREYSELLINKQWLLEKTATLLQN